MVGIYSIRNKLNDKLYIGSAKDIKKRWSVHKCELRNNKHHSPHLQKSWNLYSESAFSFDIVEECDLENLINREQYYLDTFNPEYNICKIAERCTGRILSEESRLKISIKNKGRKHTEETKRKMSEYHLNNPMVFTEDIKKKISESKKGKNNPMFGKKLSEEHRLKIGNSNKGRKQSLSCKEKIALANSIAVSQFTIQGNFVRDWVSTMEVERSLSGFKGSSVTRVCKGKRKTYKGFIWKYKK